MILVYYCKCIDLWLIKRKKICFVCKRKVIFGVNLDSDLEFLDEEGFGISERILFLVGNNNRIRRFIFDNFGKINFFFIILKWDLNLFEILNK